MKLAILSLACFSASALAFAEIAAPPAPARAPMEIMGIGPEMFADRSSAWVEAVGNVLEKAIAKLGVLAAAVYALVQNVKQRRTIREVNERVDRVAARTDTNSEHIQQVALAVPAPPVSQP